MNKRKYRVYCDSWIRYTCVTTRIDEADVIKELLSRNFYFIDLISIRLVLENNKEKEVYTNRKNKTKKVKHLETGIIYDSAKQCAKKLGITEQTISLHVLNKTIHKKFSHVQTNENDDNGRLFSS